VSKSAIPSVLLGFAAVQEVAQRVLMRSVRHSELDHKAAWSCGGRSNQNNRQWLWVRMTEHLREEDVMQDENTNGGSQMMTSTTPQEATAKPRKPRGFAAMDPKLVSELATRGGKAAHRAGTAHEFTSEEARAAGRKGALATHAKRRARAAAAAAAATNGGTNVQ
jgi:general stress protein YciG